MKDDRQLQQDVLAELAYEPSVNAASIGVTAKDGIVTLSGSVPTYAEKCGAEKAAQRVAGVRGIAEELKVELNPKSEILARAKPLSEMKTSMFAPLISPCTMFAACNPRRPSSTSMHSIVFPSQSTASPFSRWCSM